MSKLNVGVIGVVGGVGVYLMWEIHGVMVAVLERLEALQGVL